MKTFQSQAGCWPQIMYKGSKEKWSTGLGLRIPPMSTGLFICKKAYLTRLSLPSKAYKCHQKYQEMKRMITFPIVTSSNRRNSWSTAASERSERLNHSSRDASSQVTPDIFGNRLMKSQKLCGVTFVSACLLKFEKSATKRLMQQIFDKLQPDTLKSGQTCLNAHVFFYF